MAGGREGERGEMNDIRRESEEDNESAAGKSQQPAGAEAMTWWLGKLQCELHRGPQPCRVRKLIHMKRNDEMD